MGMNTQEISNYFKKIRKLVILSQIHTIQINFKISSRYTKIKV
jgi:hypothetical protein